MKVQLAHRNYIAIAILTIAGITIWSASQEWLSFLYRLWGGFFSPKNLIGYACFTLAYGVYRGWLR